MWAVLKRNPVALALAVLLHLGLAFFLIFEVDWGDKVKPIGGDVQVVQAELVDGAQLEAEKRRKAAEAAAVEQAVREKRRAEEQRKQAELEKQRKAREAQAAREKAEAEKKAAAEKARLAELKRQEAETRRKQEAERQRQAELAAQREAERKAREQAEAKAAADAARKAEEERKAREKAEAERQRKAAAEARARADREAREAELAAQFAAEQEASEQARVMGLIQAKVNRNWLRPPGTEGLKCTVRVRLGSTGTVLLVSVVESSGNVAFDRSVEAAVRKADPLPMPRSERLIARFRDLTFIFDPSS